MNKALGFARRYPVVWPLVGCVLFLLLNALATGSLDGSVLGTAARLATFSALLALAQMTVVTSGDGAIDLSQIYILTMCAYASTSFMTINPVLGFILAVALGGFAGLLNGLVNIYIRIPAMVTTLAMGYMYLTVVLVAPWSSPVPNPGFVRFTTASVGPVSVQTLIVVVVALLLGIIMYKTPFGIRLHAVGQNREAARLAGINTAKEVIGAFVIGGVLSGLAGVLCAAVMGGAFQDMGLAYFLPSIAATFVGGTAAAGGRSSVVGVVVGALMMTLMSSYLITAESVYNLPSGTRQLVMGIFLVLVLVLSVSSGVQKTSTSKKTHKQNTLVEVPS